MIEGHIEMLRKINNAMNLVADLHGWQRAVAITEVIKMLEALEEGIKASEKAHKEQVEMLMKQLEDRNNADPDAEVVGGETYEIDLRGEENG